MIYYITGCLWDNIDIFLMLLHHLLIVLPLISYDKSDWNMQLCWYFVTAGLCWCVALANSLLLEWNLPLDGLSSFPIVSSSISIIIWMLNSSHMVSTASAHQPLSTVGPRKCLWQRNSAMNCYGWTKVVESRQHLFFCYPVMIDFA
jgi:hypothetical protein